MRKIFSVALVLGLLGMSTPAIGAASKDPNTLAGVLKTSLVSIRYRFPSYRVPSNVSAQGTWAAGYVAAAEKARIAPFTSNTVDVFRAATANEVVQITAAVSKLGRGQSLPPVLAPSSSAASSISSISSTPSIPTPPPVLDIPSGSEIGVTTAAINVRSVPDFTALSRYSIPAGTQFVILDRPDEFFVHARFADGQEGYIAAKYVK